MALSRDIMFRKVPISGALHYIRLITVYNDFGYKPVVDVIYQQYANKEALSEREVLGEGSLRLEGDVAQKFYDQVLALGYDALKVDMKDAKDVDISDAVAASAATSEVR